MNRERYQQIDALTEAALKVDRSRRVEFLQRACGSDQDLLQLVTSLIDSYEASGDFLEQPALESWARDAAAASAERSLAGRDLGRFVVCERLGAGGIGEVWLARDKELSRDVALKFLSSDLAAGSDQARRFQQEARAASALNHPNIVTIYDTGEFQGQQFIAQEYIPGKTVRALLSSGAIGTEKAANIAIQIAAGLAVAHATGVVHRDIKPENIMVRPDGVVKLLDFGIARLSENGGTDRQRRSTSLTQKGVIIGTVRYMSPEQARALPVDGRSDIFSLGVVLYEMLTGTPPFAGATPSDVMAAILSHEPAPLGRSAREVPLELERIVRRCLAKDPAARYASAVELRDDLTRAAAAVKQTSLPRKAWIYAGIGLLAVAAVTVSIALRMRREAPSQFNSMKITRLATRGQVTDATIARDGKLFAYVLEKTSGQSVWIREFPGSNERLAVDTENAELSGLTFSPDDSFLFYRRRRPGELGDLYRIAVKGGAPQRVLRDVSSAVAVSPDGQHLAFVRLKATTWEASLVISSADGSSESTLVTAGRPQFIDEHVVVWPDNHSVAYFAGEARQLADAEIRLWEVNTLSHERRQITKQTWKWPRSMAWAGNPDFLIVSARTQADIWQLWLVRHDNGEVTRLTNDLSNYDAVAMTDDGKSLVAVQRETSIGIWVSDHNDLNHSTKVNPSPLSSPRSTVAWTPDGRVVYNDIAEDYRNLWTVNADGTNTARLTSSAGNKDEFVASRHYIAYEKDGHIWRASADGTNPQQLTSGPLDVHPDISSDETTLVYASFSDWSPGIGGEPTLWRIPILGGDLQQISPQPASFPVFSPDGKQLACVHYPEKDPRFSRALLATLKTDGSGGFTVLQPSPSEETPVAWDHNGKALDYVVNANGVGNIWRQPIGSGAPRPLTHFDRDELFSFAWSRDGRLACARGTTTRSAVLISNFH